MGASHSPLALSPSSLLRDYPIITSCVLGMLFVYLYGVSNRLENGISLQNGIFAASSRLMVIGYKDTFAVTAVAELAGLASSCDEDLRSVCNWNWTRLKALTDIPSPS